MRGANSPVSALILCPQIVIENWKRELISNTDIPAENIITLRGSQKERIARLLSAAGIWPNIIITNYEALLMKDLLADFETVKFEIVALDESHKCKDVSAKRTRAAIRLGMAAKYRYILSGTPVVNSPADIFSQFLFLDKGETFGKNYFAFRRNFFYDKNANMPRHCYFPDWTIRDGALQQMNSLIYKKAMRVRKSECLDLPPFVRQTVEVEMTPEQQTLYRKMERDAVAECNGKIISADLAIKKALRLQQIVTGHVVDDDKNLIRIRHNRIGALREVIESIPIDEKFVIWACFKHNYEEIRFVLESMGIKYGEVHGEVSASDQQRAIERLDDVSSGYRSLICHPASGGTGVNMVAASYSIFYSRSHNLEHDLQSEARTYRGGSERHRKVTRIDLVTPGTTDDIILNALANKQNVAEEILRYLRTKQ